MTQRGPLFFGATHHVEEVLLANMEAHPHQRYLLLRMHTVTECDFTGIEMLEGIVETYRARGGDVFLVQVRSAVRRTMEKSGFVDFLGEHNFLDQEVAIDHLFQEVIDPAICWYKCQNRVFAECQALAKRRQDIDIPPHRPLPVPDALHLELDDIEPLLKRGGALVDVRERQEFCEGHIAGSFHVPLSDIIQAPEGLPDARPLLLVCRSGRRSRRALQFLHELGYSDVFNLRGGILSWRANDRPLAQGDDQESHSAK